MKYYSPAWMAIVGFLSSIVASLQLPLFGFILSRYVFVLALDPQSEEFRSEANKWALIFFGLCIGIGLSSGIQKLCFGIGGENLTL